MHPGLFQLSWYVTSVVRQPGDLRWPSSIEDWYPVVALILVYCWNGMLTGGTIPFWLDLNP